MVLLERAGQGGKVYFSAHRQVCTPNTKLHTYLKHHKFKFFFSVSGSHDLSVNFVDDNILLKCLAGGTAHHRIEGLQTAPPLLEQELGDSW